MEPSASPKTLLDSALEVAAVFITPNWNELIALLPVFLGLLVIAWAAITIRGYATLPPRRRVPARVQPLTPAHLHMPGGSVAPILAALGAAALFFGLVAGGLALWVGVLLLVLTLLVWFREGMQDYAKIDPAAARALVPVVHEGPPPGVHMPGPSIRPLLGALGSAALLGGLVIGGWVLILAVVFLVWTLLGWLVDFTAEYRKVEEADHTGHLENIPARPLPMRALQVFSVAFALLILWQLGIFPPAPPATAGGPGASPGAPAGPSLPPGAQEVDAKGVKFLQTALTVKAGEAFSIFFRNEDPATTPHDIDIRSADGAQVLKDQPHTAGGESQLYQYDALQAGTYQFICSVHPVASMTGTLTVE